MRNPTAAPTADGAATPAMTTNWRRAEVGGAPAGCAAAQNPTPSKPTAREMAMPTTDAPMTTYPNTRDREARLTALAAMRTALSRINAIP